MHFVVAGEVGLGEEAFDKGLEEGETAPESLDAADEAFLARLRGGAVDAVDLAVATLGLL